MTNVFVFERKILRWNDCLLTSWRLLTGKFIVFHNNRNVYVHNNRDINLFTRSFFFFVRMKVISLEKLRNCIAQKEMKKKTDRTRNQLYHVLLTMAFFPWLVFGIWKGTNPFVLLFGIVIISELSTFVTRHLHIISLPSYFLIRKKKRKNIYLSLVVFKCKIFFMA